MKCPRCYGDGFDMKLTEMGASEIQICARCGGSGELTFVPGKMIRRSHVPVTYAIQLYGHIAFLPDGGILRTDGFSSDRATWLVIATLKTTVPWCYLINAQGDMGWTSGLQMFELVT